MEAITGEKDYDASAILEYFAPLRKMLNLHKKKLSEQTNQTIPIVVACICGAILLVGIAVMTYKHLKKKKNREV